jgi:glycerol-3-phosphate cytidylyltransferase-like family protein
MNFLNYLNEAKGDQLDISILSAGKVLTNKQKIEDFLTSTVTVEHKTDGIKLTIIKKDNKGNINDYVFSYKGQVLYSKEYEFNSKVKVKKESIGPSQFRLVFDHFSKLGKNSIPVDTELFVEFLMSKPTLSSNYNTKHKMVLIGHAKTKWEEKFGRLKSSPGPMDTSKRDDYAKQIKIDVPQLLFVGTMGSAISFSAGIMNKNLKSEFEARKNSMTWDNAEILIDDLRQLFLAIESKYGGKEEGVVMKYNDRIIKWQQEYQLDQAARAAIKAQYRSDTVEDENAYWEYVHAQAFRLSNSIVVKSRKLNDVLEELALTLKKLKIEFNHSKKTESMIKDDIQLDTKTLLVKKMRGNNNALILGKFRVLTKDGHYKLIKRAAALYDNVVVCVVTSKDTKDTKQFRYDMMKKVFPNVEIIEHGSGNLMGIMGKSPININAVYAGSDRVSAYKEQLKRVLGVEVKEMPRTDNDISASKVIANIDDEEFFKKNTPNELHSMYDEIKKVYS